MRHASLAPSRGMRHVSSLRRRPLEAFLEAAGEEIKATEARGVLQTLFPADVELVALGAPLGRCVWPRTSLLNSI